MTDMRDCVDILMPPMVVFPKGGQRLRPVRPRRGQRTGRMALVWGLAALLQFPQPLAQHTGFVLGRLPRFLLHP